MIAARKHALVGALFALYNKHLLRKNFHRIRVAGIEKLSTLDRSAPIVFYANHSNWWDGLVAFLLTRDLFNADAYAMMEERQLKRYRFFRWIGAFSVNRDSPRSAMESVVYARKVFDRPNRALWIFPQGEMKPNDVRPLGFQRGIARLATDGAGTQFVPVACRYEFLFEQRPECYVSVGEIARFRSPDNLRTMVACLEDSLTLLLDSLRCSVISGEVASFATVLSGRQSANTWYDRVFRRAPLHD